MKQRYYIDRDGDFRAYPFRGWYTSGAWQRFNTNAAYNVEEKYVKHSGCPRVPDTLLLLVGTPFAV